jgi:hypothetical protein
MRTVVLLLLLANLTLFAYTRLDNVGTGEGARLKEQVQPDKIKLLTPQQVAALGPAKVAALSDVCVEWGPFGAAELAKATADLEPLQLGRLLTQRRVDIDNAWWVNVGPFANRASAEKRATELRAQNISDVSVADAPRGQYAVSFGVFRTEQAALARANALIEQGVKTAKAEPRQQSVAQNMLVVRDPQQSAMARLKDLLPQYPGSDIKVGACPST